MRNSEDISKVTLTKQIKAWCPIGKQGYLANVTVEVLPVDEIPDYCKLDKELDNINGEALIIEELATEVYAIAKAAFGNAPAKATVDVKESAHMPVTVAKGDF